jgi:hypothetical protein
MLVGNLKIENLPENAEKEEKMKGTEWSSKFKLWSKKINNWIWVWHAFNQNMMFYKKRVNQINKQITRQIQLNPELIKSNSHLVQINKTSLIPFQ